MNNGAHNKFQFNPCDGRDISLFARQILEKLGTRRPAGGMATEELYTSAATIRLASTESGHLHTYIINPHDTIGSTTYITQSSSPNVYVDHSGGRHCRVSDTSVLDGIELTQYLKGIQGITEPGISSEGERRFRSIAAGIAMDSMLGYLARAAQDKGARALTQRKLRQLPVGHSSQESIPKK